MCFYNLAPETFKKKIPKMIRVKALVLDDLSFLGDRVECLSAILTIVKNNSCSNTANN